MACDVSPVAMFLSALNEKNPPKCIIGQLKLLIFTFHLTELFLPRRCPWLPQNILGMIFSLLLEQGGT